MSVNIPADLVASRPQQAEIRLRSLHAHKRVRLSVVIGKLRASKHGDLPRNSTGYTIEIGQEFGC